VVTWRHRGPLTMPDLVSRSWRIRHPSAIQYEIPPKEFETLVVLGTDYAALASTRLNGEAVGTTRVM
jgi:hypothetical protein